MHTRYTSRRVVRFPSRHHAVKERSQLRVSQWDALSWLFESSAASAGPSFGIPIPYEGVYTLSLSMSGPSCAHPQAHNAVVVVDTQQGRVRAMLCGHTNRVTVRGIARRPPPTRQQRAHHTPEHDKGLRLQAVAFLGEARDQLLLASGSADKSVRVWHAISGEQRKVLRAHNADITAVAASPQLRDLLVSADVKGHGACVHCLARRRVCLPTSSLSLVRTLHDKTAMVTRSSDAQQHVRL
jgi:WD40 repeat protein